MAPNSVASCSVRTLPSTTKRCRVSGHLTWTAANGDQIFSSTTGEAVVNFPIVTIEEKQIITGGTGRFVGATGT